MKAAEALVCPVPPFAMLTGWAQFTESVPEEVTGLPVTVNVFGIVSPMLVTVPPPLPPPDTRRVWVEGS